MKDENGSGRYALGAMPFAFFNKEDANPWVDLLLLLDERKVFLQSEKGVWTKDISGERKEFKKGLGLFF